MKRSFVVHSMLIQFTPKNTSIPSRPGHRSMLFPPICPRFACSLHFFSTSGLSCSQGYHVQLEHIPVAQRRKYVKRPVRPANMALPVRCDAAPVDEEGEGEEDVELPVRLPPEPATAVGDTFSVASAEAFLKAASVFAPDLLTFVSVMIVLE
jgi:hypothetical protein